MNSLILKVLITAARLLHVEGYDYESYQLDLVCGVAYVSEVAAELDYLVPVNSAARPMVELMGDLNPDAIVNIPCDDDIQYRWNVRE